jgi:hypothetical protein
MIPDQGTLTNNIKSKEFFTTKQFIMSLNEETLMYLIMNVHQAFNYLTKQLPDTAHITVQPSVDAVTQSALLAEFHLHAIQISRKKS